MASTLTLNQTISAALPVVGFLPLNLGSGNGYEPAVTNANEIKQMILNAPFGWRWNRVAASFSATTGTQDYSVALGGASQSVTGITQANPAVFTVATAPATGSSVSITGATGNWTPINGSWLVTNLSGTTYSIPVDSTSFGSVTGTILSQAGNDNFGWIEQASLKGADNKVYQINFIKNVLTADANQNRPTWISPLIDNNAGSITWRLTPVPEQNYTVNILYQQKPTLFPNTSSALTQTWSPIPDEMSVIYNHGFKALALLYKGDERWVGEYQQFLRSLVSSSEGLSAEQKGVFVENMLATKLQASRAGLVAGGQQ
jgi:hypothetical protein